MTSRPRFKPYAWEPLQMTPAEVAEVVFRRSPSWFADHVPEDFPRPVDGLYATEAVREWVRRRHGLAAPQDSPQAARNILLGRLKHGAGSRAVSG